jgi:hypothetical protein
MGSDPMILARPPDLGSRTWDPKVLAMKLNGGRQSPVSLLLTESGLVVT